MSSISKAWKVIKPHVPLIQFKKGGRATQHQTTSKTSHGSNTVVILDDTMLPPKYQRKPLSELEIQLIQTGGVPL